MHRWSNRNKGFTISAAFTIRESKSSKAFDNWFEVSFWVVSMRLIILERPPNKGSKGITQRSVIEYRSRVKQKMATLQGFSDLGNE